MMNEARLKEILGRFSSLRIAVVGDIFLDRLYYIDRKRDEPSVETGLTAYQVDRKICAPGAAGVITNNISTLGVGTKYALTVTGDDGDAYDLRQALVNSGINIDYMLTEKDRFTATYNKFFFDWDDRPLEETHRVDQKNLRKMRPETEQQVIRSLLELENKVDAIVCLEQLREGSYGVFTPAVVHCLSEIGRRKKVMVFVDSRYNLAKFSNVIKKCNDNEILRAVGIDAPLDGEMTQERRENVEKAMRAYAKESAFPVIVTCGAMGMEVLEQGELKIIPGFHVKGPIDICGAGDSATTGIACALAAGASLSEAALVGNLIASIIVQQIGVTGTATQEQLLRRYQEYEERCG